ncbi:MAG: Gfo/Idh/MocA family oxidoreductase [Clostridia bacterium]|nr:Gfo/Idh/MocA family oxidoreductase [Clostridia bacterium]
MKIGFIGNGWRTNGYWRIVRQVPEKFEISGVLFRNAEKAAAYGALRPRLAFTDIDEFLRQDHDMVFILLPRQVVLPYIEKCLAAGFPLLLETPPADGLDQLKEVWALQQKYSAKIQVAEQYFLQPYHKAVRALVDRGLLGDVSNLRIAMAHDYHGISIMRRLLGAGDKPCVISAQQFSFPVLRHCGREGLVRGADTIRNDSRKVAAFSFDGGKVGFFDFAGEQYFNYFRSRHLNVQGTHGEINDYSVTYWNDGLPMTGRMERQDTGRDSNLEGYFHRGITWNGSFIYENPFAPFVEARLTDDEIAMGSLLLGMERMMQTGEEIYPLKEALQDTYLYLMMDEAIRLGRPVETKAQPWQEV